MDKGILSDRERAAEAAYFREQESRLLERLRQRASLDDIAVALAEKLQLDNPDLLARARQLGLTRETAGAIFVAPLVQVAWAEGSVTRHERDVVLRLARDRGVEPNSPAYAQLEEWLRVRPEDSFFETALEIIRYGFAVLPPKEKEERIQRIVQACHEVATASASGIAVLGLGSSESNAEAAIIDTITHRLRGHG